MTKPDTKRWILIGALFLAVILFTALLRVPLGIEREKAVSGSSATIAVDSGNYINLGDCAVFVCALLLGGPWGALVAAVGSALADFFVGSAVYAIPTILIKGGMAFLAAWFIKTKSNSWATYIKLVCFCGLIMVAGYFLFDLIIMGDYSVAALALPANLLQLLVNGLIAIPVLKLLSWLSYYKKEESFYDFDKASRVK